MTTSVRFCDPVLALGEFHNVQIVDVGGMMVERHVREMKTAADALAASFPDGFVSVTFVRPGTTMIEKGARTELAASMKAQRDLNAHSVVLLEDKGVLASAMRTMLKTLILMSSNKHLEVAANYEDCMRLVLPRARTKQGKSLTRAELDAAIGELRAAYEKQKPR